MSQLVIFQLDYAYRSGSEYPRRHITVDWLRMAEDCREPRKIGYLRAGEGGGAGGSWSPG